MLHLQLCNSKALHTSHTYIKIHCTHAHCTFYQIGFRTQIATCNPILRRCDFWSKQRSNLYISLNVKPEVQTLNSLWLPTCLLWFTPVHKNLACMSKDYHDMKIDFFFLFSFNFGMRVLLHTRTKESSCFLRRPQKSIWRLLHTVKLMVKVLSIFVAFSENVNFNNSNHWVDFGMENLSCIYLEFLKNCRFIGCWLN